ncbi:hypothetical protein TNCV_2191171 [Trichonephila clavipes]|nr:hypothetical protein TNCV_2191171 [Trichonephila clavipes]
MKVFSDGTVSLMEHAGRRFQVDDIDFSDKPLSGRPSSLMNDVTVKNKLKENTVLTMGDCAESLNSSQQTT